MKKILGVLLSLVMVFSIGCFAGCDSSDNKALLDRIAALEEQLESAGNNDTQALLAKIAELEKQLDNSVGDSELTNDVATLKATVAEFKTTITTLSDTVTSLSNALDTQKRNTQHTCPLDTWSTAI